MANAYDEFLRQRRGQHAQAFDARTAEIDRQREADKEARDAAFLERLKADYQRKFMATAGASVAEFDRLWPGMLQAWRLSEMEAGPEREKERLRKTGLYNL